MMEYIVGCLSDSDLHDLLSESDMYLQIDRRHDVYQLGQISKVL